MKNRFFMRAVCLALVAILVVPAMIFGNNGNGAEDGLIQIDPVERNTYTGRPQATRLIGQLQYADMPVGHSAAEAIVRAGVFDIMRPVSPQFRPNAPVTREEAVAYALRAAGLSDRARALGVTRTAELDLPPNTPLSAAWSLGYFQLAQTIGMISESDLEDATAEITANIAVQEPTENGNGDGYYAAVFALFQPNAPATREEIAFWLVTALEYASSDIFETEVAGFATSSFVDWNSISPHRAAAVETVLRHRIINGQSPTVFGANGTVTRGQMAQILRNLGNLHLGIHGFERRVGTVSDFTFETSAELGARIGWVHIRVRRSDGGIDVLRHTTEERIIGSPEILDAVVFRNGRAGGLETLSQNDQIEYFIHEDGTLLYVVVGGEADTRVESNLRLELIDMENGTMTFRTRAGTVITYPMIDGLHGEDRGVPFIRMRGNQLFPAAELPRGAFYNVTLVGNVITAIDFVGNDVLIPEHRGIVVINNPEFGFLTILDSNRNERDFTYNPAQLIVHRRQFYDMRDTIGGMHEMFQPILPDPRAADISNVIIGDIVVFRVAEDDPYRIIEIFAVENTITRYGRIMQIIDHGGYFDMMMQFENGRNAWYRFVQGILVTSNGVPSNPNVIQPGDWARITINQHVIAPGIMEESIREIAIDGGGHHITGIISGQLAGFNAAQNQLQIHNAQELTPAGWGNNRPLASINIGGSNVRYFHNGTPVTLAHINRYLQRDPNAVVYMAIENHFAGERAVHVNILAGGRLTRYGTILAAANNRFNMLEVPGTIQADPGTIVVRNGRLVGVEHITASDWARVSLVGQTAAVVDIGSAPSTAGVQIVRGRISRVMPFENFRVETMSIFDGFRWNFTPIAREFTIDQNTLFINESGVTSIDSFIGYTDDSVIGSVFNVVVEGGRAARVISAPHTEPIPQTHNVSGHLTVRGIIYEISGDTVSLRDMTVFNARTGAWNRFSNVNATGSVTIQANTIIVDRDEVIPGNRLRVGQQIMAFSDERVSDVDLEPGLSADVYIVLVEN